MTKEETDALQTCDKVHLLIEQTEWAKKFALETPWFYDQAIRIVSSPDFAVRISYSLGAGVPRWVIWASNNAYFWLESFPTKEEAIDFCEEMRWKVTSNDCKEHPCDDAVQQAQAPHTQGKVLLPIEQTEWARKFALEAHWFYGQAIRIVSSPDFAVRVEYSTETGEHLWAVIAINTDSFWMDAFPTREEAVDFCNKMNWKVIPP